MKYALIVIAINLAARVRLSHEDCRVLADCDGGTALWKDLSFRGSPGRPGKRGAQGLQGQKGEPGVGVNVAELKERLQDDGGPKLYNYANTITWDSGKSFCKSVGKNLCSFDQICIPKGGGRQLTDDVIHGDHWVPVLDDHNEWAEIGDHYGAPCWLHSVRWSKPPWGTSSAIKPYKGYVYCCKSTLPSIANQYIGETVTYASSEHHCENLGRRLCYSSEICSNSKPVFGVVGSDHWAAIKDRRNDWIQIGNSGLRCGLHGVQLGLPAWGTRTDGSSRTYVGYVLCCEKNENK